MAVSNTPLNKDSQGNVSQFVNMNGAQHRQVALDDTTPVLISSDSAYTRLIVQNYSDSSGIIFIGDANVSNTGATKGLEIAVGSGYEFNVTGDVALYAIAATGLAPSILAMEMY